jgi:hypothetical protein
MANLLGMIYYATPGTIAAAVVFATNRHEQQKGRLTAIAFTSLNWTPLLALPMPEQLALLLTPGAIFAAIAAPGTRAHARAALDWSGT